MEDKSIRVTDRHVFFWGGWLSNWYPARFTVWTGGEKVQFENSEQYFMYMKAVMFKDYETAGLILEKGSDPKEAKRLGRAVRNFDSDVWDLAKIGFMYNANWFKYKQNPDLLARLTDKSLAGKRFVEGSPEDKVWGIGVSWKTASDDESTWDGENLLGKVLDAVRDSVLAENRHHLSDDYVTFNTAKLLQSNGFDEPCFTHFGPDGTVYRVPSSNPILDDGLNGFVPRPTLQLAAKWLREVHRCYLHVVPFFPDDNYGNPPEWIPCAYYNGECYPSVPMCFAKYEAAVEFMVGYCLKNLIDGK